jgi:hypothetical protein
MIDSKKKIEFGLKLGLGAPCCVLAFLISALKKAELSIAD